MLAWNLLTNFNEPFIKIKHCSPKIELMVTIFASVWFHFRSRVACERWCGWTPYKCRCWQQVNWSCWYKLPSKWEDWGRCSRSPNREDGSTLWSESRPHTRPLRGVSQDSIPNPFVEWVKLHPQPINSTYPTTPHHHTQYTKCGVKVWCRRII